MSANGSDARGRLTGLEALRFACAFGVLLFHYHQFAFQPGKGFTLSPDRALPFSRILEVFYANGSFAVPIFWCISGFIFFWKYQAQIANRTVGFKKFIILRFTRLYPLHFVTLVLVAGMQLLYFRKFGAYFVYQANNLRHFVLQLGMASNWFPGAPYSFNGPIWSVSLEVLVYLLFFVVAAYLTSSRAFNVVVMLCALVLIRVPALLPAQQIIKCVGFFYAGGASASAHQWLDAHDYTTEKWCRLRLSSGIILGILVIAAVFFWLHKYFRDLKIEFLLLTVPFLLLVLAQELPVRERIRELIDIAGNMTYGSYLIHFPLQIAIILVAGELDWKVSVYNPFLLLGFIFGSFLLAFFVYQYFEAPAQKKLRGMLLPRQ